MSIILYQSMGRKMRRPHGVCRVHGRLWKGGPNTTGLVCIHHQRKHTQAALVRYRNKLRPSSAISYEQKHEPLERQPPCLPFSNICLSASHAPIADKHRVAKA